MWSQMTFLQISWKKSINTTGINKLLISNAFWLITAINYVKIHFSVTHRGTLIKFDDWTPLILIHKHSSRHKILKRFSPQLSSLLNDLFSQFFVFFCAFENIDNPAAAPSWYFTRKIFCYLPSSDIFSST